MRSNGRDWSRHQGRTDVELIAEELDVPELVDSEPFDIYELGLPR